jgi:GNAT superfamily N-acetyltransferase
MLHQVIKGYFYRFMDREILLTHDQGILAYMTFFLYERAFSFSLCWLLFITGCPVAWYIMRDDGFQGLLHVKEDHRRKGLATLLINKLRVVLQSHELQEVIGVSNGSIVSRDCFLKQGFRDFESMEFLSLMKDEG